MTVTDWPADANMSPFRLIGWKQACSDLDVSSDSLILLLTKHEIPVVQMGARKRAVLARDLVRLVSLRQKSASGYAVAKRAAVTSEAA